MAKKETTDFSDEMLHNIMMGDNPISKHQHISGNNKKDGETSLKLKANNSKESERAARKIEQFKEIYLVPQRIRTRSAVYIDYELQSLIKSYIWTIAPNVSISAYITNILKHHVNTYHAEINEIRRTRFEEVWAKEPK